MPKHKRTLSETGVRKTDGRLKRSKSAPPRMRHKTNEITMKSAMIATSTIKNVLNLKSSKEKKDILTSEIQSTTLKTVITGRTLFLNQNYSILKEEMSGLEALLWNEGTYHLYFDSFGIEIQNLETPILDIGAGYSLFPWEMKILFDKKVDTVDINCDRIAQMMKNEKDMEKLLVKYYLGLDILYEKYYVKIPYNLRLLIKTLLKACNRVNFTNGITWTGYKEDLALYQTSPICLPKTKKYKIITCFHVLMYLSDEEAAVAIINMLKWNQAPGTIFIIPGSLTGVNAVLTIKLDERKNFIKLLAKKAEISSPHPLSDIIWVTYKGTKWCIMCEFITLKETGISGKGVKITTLSPD